MARHKNTLIRIDNVRRITQQHYEPGVQAKCYKAVWRNYIYPIYPMCYHTYMAYINEPPPPREDYQQLSLLL